jgi:hypothetical protein
MSKPAQHRCNVRLVGRGCEHELCYPVRRGVPPELRCGPGAPAGYGGGPGCCEIPPDLEARVDRELRSNLEEWKRRGHVLIRTG